MRSFLLLLALDVAIVAGGIALFGPHRGPPAPAQDAEPLAASRRLAAEARALRAEAERLATELASASAGHTEEPLPRDAAVGPTPTGVTLPDDDLDLLEVAIQAVDRRRALERGREGLRVAVRHVYPDLGEDQQRDVAEAIGAYREILEAALRPGGDGALAGHAAGVQELRRRLTDVVTPARADEIVLRYAIPPGAPARPPVVSPPLRRD